jgi:hypothetical protein
VKPKMMAASAAPAVKAPASTPVKPAGDPINR